MKAHLESLFLALSLVVSLPWLAGCLAAAAGGAAAGAGAVAYVRGDLETNLDASLARTTAAVKGAIPALKLTLLSETTEPARVKIKARNAEGKTITFTATALTDRATHLSIRVGTFGDEAQSQQILAEVKKAL